MQRITLQSLCTLFLLTLVGLSNAENLSENAVGIDLRTRAELFINPSNNSTHIPISDLKQDITQKLPNKNTPIYLFCQSGGRSAKGMLILKELGYTNLIDVKTWKRWNTLSTEQRRVRTKSVQE